MHKTNRGREWRRKKESLRLASAVLCVIFILILRSKLILVQLPGATGLFIELFRWRSPKGIGALDSRAILPPGGKAAAASGVLPAQEHRAEGREHQMKVEAVCLFPPFRTAHSQGKFKCNQRPLISEPQLSGMELRKKTHTQKWCVNDQNRCSKARH